MLEPCPTSLTLANYLAGKLSRREAEEIDEHLQSCPRCIELADQTSGGHDTLMRALRCSLVGDALAAEPELAAALGAIGGYSTSNSGDAPATRMVRDYQLLDILGEGGMGTVYRAIHTRLERTVAFKLMRPDRVNQADAVQRFQREMRVLGNLKHVNIVQAFDAGKEQEEYFLVMEYIDGVDLAQLTRRLGALAISDACEIVRQAALGLAHAHQHDKVHRDVKPANLMLATDGVVKVLDLGLAQLRGPLPDGDDLTRDGQVMGTRFYMSPEQLMGAKNLTAATDIYSLGVAFYQFLAGNIPLKDGQFALHLPPLENQRAGIPGPLRQIVQAMLCRAVDDRPASMESVAEMLKQYSSGANLPNLLRRFHDSQCNDWGMPMHALVAGLAPASPEVPSALRPTEPFDTTDRRPEAPPLPPPVMKKFGKSRSGLRKLFAIAGGFAGVAALFAAAMFFWPPPVVDPRGTLLLQVTPEQRKWLDLRGREVFLIPMPKTDHLDRIPLSLGPNPLPPPGDYRIETSDPNIEISVAGQDAPATLTVADETITVQIAVRTGILTLQVASELMREVVDKTTGCGIFAVPSDSPDNTAGIRLHEGDNQLPAGKYRLITPAWMLDFDVQGQPAPPLLVVDASRPLSLSGKVRLDFPWSLPEIPAENGAFAAAYGTLRRPSASGGAEVELKYDLKMTVLGNELVGKSPHQWLEIYLATTQAGDKYEETAYLLIDADLYRQRRELRAARGWITAETPDLKSQLASFYPDNAPEALVVAFDPQSDALAERARERRLIFPKDRVSVQEAMALLFEADFAGGLPQAVQDLRKKLASLRKLHFESFNGTKGEEACLVVRAEIPHPVERDAPPPVHYTLKRAEHVPFSFMSIVVESPQFSGTYYLDDYDAPPAASAESNAPDEPQLQTWAKIFDPPGVQQRFDVVSLPEKAGAKQRYAGRLVAPAQCELAIDYDVDLWVGDAEEIGDVLWRPLAVVVESGPSGRKDWTEKAWLWIDDNRYRKDFRLVAKPERSFIEIGGEVFPYLEEHGTIVDDLHRLGHPPPAARIGIHDALALLCGADHLAAPNFNLLRAQIADAIDASGKSRESSAVKLTLPGGKESWGQRWEPPLGETTYHIDRTRALPFGIHTVFLQHPPLDLQFTAHAKSFTEQDGLAIVGGHPWWEQHEKFTANKIAAIQPGNFRLWKRDDGSVIAWAEYLADANGRVAVRDAAGDTVVFQQADLAPSQWVDMRVRTWQSAKRPRTISAEYSGQQGGQWTLRIRGADKKPENPEYFSAADAQWVNHHENALAELRARPGD